MFVATIGMEQVGPLDGSVEARRELGSVSLSQADLDGLDALLKFYRTNSLTGCTTKDKISISHVRAGKVIATEDFVDASCRSRRVKGVLTIPALLARPLSEPESRGP
jgi:hypothetical protein